MVQNFEKFNKSILCLGICLGLLFSVGLAGSAKATNASLNFSPNQGTFFIGSTFDVSIFLNTGKNNINAIKVDLKFNPRKLQIANPTSGKSFISIWAAQPVYSNILGTASFQGGVPSPGINASSGLVSTITFRAIAPGETFISFLDSSQVLLDDGKGTNILSSLGKGIYNFIISPPEGPDVFSSTHSDQNRWYKNNNPTFSWEKEQGVNDFSYSIDYDCHGVPDNISEGNHTSVSYNDLADGIWYFHIKAKKGNSWGGTSHYLAQIDATKPADFSLVFQPKLKSSVMVSKEPIVSFITTDAFSGIDHYELKTIDFNKADEKKEAGFFVEINSPYKLPILDPGEYQIVVRSYDLAGNWRDVSKKIEVISSEKVFYVAKGGISVLGVYFCWWKVILIFAVLIIFILIIIFSQYRAYKHIRERRETLKQVKNIAEEEEKKFKNKLHGS